MYLTEQAAGLGFSLKPPAWLRDLGREVTGVISERVVEAARGIPRVRVEAANGMPAGLSTGLMVAAGAAALLLFISMSGPRTVSRR